MTVPASPGRHPYVIVIDPYGEDGEMYAEYLRTAGFAVQVFRHASDALPAIETDVPDVLVTRLRQSTEDIDGIDVVQRLRGGEATTALPIVMITSSMTDGDRDAARKARCDAYMLLPVLPDQLAAEIRRLLPPVIRARGGVS